MLQWKQNHAFCVCVCVVVVVVVVVEIYEYTYVTVNYIGCPNKSARFNFVIKRTIYSKSADIFVP